MVVARLLYNVEEFGKILSEERLNPDYRVSFHYHLILYVNTQFRAYPFYKASEWMPHKKLLLNSIVF